MCWILSTKTGGINITHLGEIVKFWHLFSYVLNQNRMIPITRIQNWMFRWTLSTKIEGISSACFEQIIEFQFILLCVRNQNGICPISNIQNFMFNWILSAKTGGIKIPYINHIIDLNHSLLRDFVQGLISIRSHKNRNLKCEKICL